MGLWLPITAFVTVGLEHSIANMWVALRRLRWWHPHYARNQAVALAPLHESRCS